MIHTQHYDVVVVGGGSAGVAAAISAKRNGASVVLIDAGPNVGGEMLSGLPIDGCLNGRGEWIVGGVARELFAGCEALGGYIGPVFDWRLIHAVCVDPEVFKLVVVDELARHGVPLLLYTFAQDVVAENGAVRAIEVVNKRGRTLITGDVFVDCSGDGDVAVMAGAESEKGSPGGEFQPVTLVFRMSNVDGMAYLRFVRDHPDEFILGESPIIDKTPAECAQALYDQGLPFAGLSAKGSVLSHAIATGAMFPTMAVYIWPTSLQRREVGFNTTRIADLDATDSEALSRALSGLTQQVGMAMRFAKEQLPGFDQAFLSGVAPRVGIRETRRIVGDYVLTREDVVTGRKSSDVIAKGGHHVDVHGSGTNQVREPVRDGDSYDIPFGCLIPKSLSNVLIAGRSLSSTREAHGSARVMGQCLATGEAAGLAAAMCAANGWTDVRSVPVHELQERLKAQGAVIDGTH